MALDQWCILWIHAIPWVGCMLAIPWVGCMLSPGWGACYPLGGMHAIPWVGCMLSPGWGAWAEPKMTLDVLMLFLYKYWRVHGKRSKYLRSLRFDSRRKWNMYFYNTCTPCWWRQFIYAMKIDWDGGIIHTRRQNMEPSLVHFCFYSIAVPGWSVISG